MALIALGRVRARRGDPAVWEALNEAKDLAGSTGTLQRVAPMHAARAEAAWLEGRVEDAAAQARAGVELALRKKHAWFTSELLFWCWRASGATPVPVPEFCASYPFSLEVRGQWHEAADGWRERGCPFETARALSGGDEAAQREALAMFEALGARPMAERVRHALRAAGVRGLPRGPRRATQSHPAGLTTREVAVLALLAQGLRTKEIGRRLNRSARTVDHHLASIFAKLAVATRAEAVSAAFRLGVIRRERGNRLRKAPAPWHFQTIPHRGACRKARVVTQHRQPFRTGGSRSHEMTGHAVVIAGGGPTGLMLAGELALAGVDVAIVERRASQDLPGSRAGGLHSRTLEILEQRGIADRFLAEGQVVQAGQFSGVRLDISNFPTRHPYSLGLWQKHIERILAGWVGELEVPVYRGRDVTGFAQDETGVDVQLSDGQSLRAQYLAGCDGGRSLVRKVSGIEFPGWDPTTSSLIAQVELAETPQWGIRQDAIGMHALGRVDYKIRDGKVVYADSGPVGVMVTEAQLGPASEPTLRDLSEALIRVYGTDYGVHSPTWISRFTDMTRQAATYRDRRVLLAGDAAHIHSPDGAQGLQTGVQDAVNLGWKLAQVVNRTSPESLLDTYHAERHPVAARLLRITMAHVALRRPDERTAALRDTIAEFLMGEESRRRFAAMMFGLDIRYDLGLSDIDKRHPLLGRRMPDLDLVTADGPVRVFTLLHAARPVLLNLGSAGVDITPWANRVQSFDATYAGAWELPVIGVVPAPSAVLIRPDGYVAWVGDQTQLGLADALTTWFGPPAA